MATIEKVKDFWNRNVNAANLIEPKELGTQEGFEKIRQIRYKYHYHLLPLFDKLALKYRGKRCLEIGCGMGIDLVELAKRGIEVIGIDLTEKAIDLACKHFKEKKLQAKFKVANAESLPFKNEEFDLVYSFGVLHHTPNTQKAIDEIFRVLKPGGGAYIMLYHKNSLNYLVHRILNYPFDGNKKDPCPEEKTYTKKKVRKMFSKFSYLQVKADYLFGTGWREVNYFVPIFVKKALGKIWGWHLMIEAIK